MGFYCTLDEEVRTYCLGTRQIKWRKSLPVTEAFTSPPLRAKPGGRSLDLLFPPAVARTAGWELQKQSGRRTWQFRHSRTPLSFEITHSSHYRWARGRAEGRRVRCSTDFAAGSAGKRMRGCEHRARAAEGPVSKISSKRLCRSVCLGDVQGGRKAATVGERSALVARNKNRALENPHKDFTAATVATLVVTSLCNQKDRLQVRQKSIYRESY